MDARTVNKVEAVSGNAVFDWKCTHRVLPPCNHRLILQPVAVDEFYGKTNVGVGEFQ